MSIPRFVRFIYLSCPAFRFGFVNFDDPSLALKAVEAMNGNEFGGKNLYCGRAQKKAERENMLRQQYEVRRLERIEKYQVSCDFLCQIRYV